MQILEGIVDSLIMQQQVVSIYDSRRALFQEEHYRCNLRQMHEKCLIMNKYICMAILDLEKQLTVPLENLSNED